MAAQGERVSGVLDMCSLVGESMAQDEETEQEMLVVEEQEQSPPQMDPEPEMGAAAVYDTPLTLSTKTPRSWPSRLSRAHLT